MNELFFFLVLGIKKFRFFGIIKKDIINIILVNFYIVLCLVLVFVF